MNNLKNHSRKNYISLLLYRRRWFWERWSEFNEGRWTVEKWFKAAPLVVGYCQYSLILDFEMWAKFECLNGFEFKFVSLQEMLFSHSPWTTRREHWILAISREIEILVSHADRFYGLKVDKNRLSRLSRLDAFTLNNVRDTARNFLGLVNKLLGKWFHLKIISPQKKEKKKNLRVEIHSFSRVIFFFKVRWSKKFLTIEEKSSSV